MWNLARAQRADEESSMPSAAAMADKHTSSWCNTDASVRVGWEDPCSGQISLAGAAGITRGEKAHGIPW